MRTSGLRVGTKVRVTAGRYTGHKGWVVGAASTGVVGGSDYLVQLDHPDRVLVIETKAEHLHRTRW